MNRHAILLGLVSALTIPASAQALGFIIVGNQPIGPEGGYTKEVLAAVNVEERVYAYIHDFQQTFYFKGGPKALNQAMRHFAAIPDDNHEIILLPAPGKPLIDDKPVAFDWSLRVAGGRTGRAREVVVGRSDFTDDRATLTIYIPEPLPPAPADPKTARKWIGDIGSNDFKTREVATRELTALGSSVVALLREAMKTEKSAEARDRMERLLGEMSKEIRLDVLQFPKDMPVTSLDSHLARCRKALESKFSNVRGDAAGALVVHGDAGKDVVLDLERIFKTEQEIGALIGAVRATWCLGAEAKVLLPALRELAKTTDKNLKNYCDQAIARIEKTNVESGGTAEEAKKRATIRMEIRDHVAGLKQKQ
jgi:hypothetical protein